MKPTASRDVECLPRDEQRDQPAQSGERHDPEDKGLAQPAELGVQQQQHHPEHEAENESKPRLRTLLIFELAAIFEAVLGHVKFHGLRDPRFHFIEIRRDVPVGQIDADRTNGGGCSRA